MSPAGTRRIQPTRDLYLRLELVVCRLSFIHANGLH